MPDYKLELGPYVVHLTCECCHKPVLRVWGLVSKDGCAHAVYYALLAGHEDGARRVNLTLSVGKWWEDDPATVASRHWCHMQARNQAGKAVVRVEEPTESNQYPWPGGGQAMTREQVLGSPLRDEFFAVTDFLSAEDPAIRSYLLGQEVNIQGRGSKQEDGTVEFVGPGKGS